jgi:PAS domain S-box-containing protein
LHAADSGCRHMGDMVEYRDLLDVHLLQRIQDDFAKIANVGSVIYDLKGMPITKPSNFCGYCKLIRSTEKGRQNCINSDAELWKLGESNQGGAILCKSGRLMDGIAPIIVEGRRIANWGMGQVLFADPDEDWIRWYARDIGVDEEALIGELKKIKKIPKEDFLKTIELLMTLSRELSEIALANFRLKKEIRGRIKSEERYRAIVKNAIVGICEITNRGYLEYVNDQLHEMLGYEMNELLGKRVNYILKSDRDFESYFKGIVDYANRSFAKIGYDFNGVLIKKNKDLIPCRICLTPQKNLSNQIVKSSAVIIDVSAEVKALQELEDRNRELFESKKQMDLFFDSNTNALCIYDNTLTRLKYNPAYRKFVDEIGKTESLQNGDLWEPIDNKYLQQILSGERRECEVKEEYGVKLYSIKATPIPDYDDSISRLLITIEDITNYHLMMENALFAEKMSGVGMLASGIAHDMKGIFAVLGNSNCSMKKLVSTGDEQEFKKRLNTSLGVQEEGLKHGRKLLSQLISLSGKNAENRESFQLKECVENIVRIYNSEILNKNANVEINIREQVVIKGLQSQFIQIIMNLFSNALDAIENNGDIHIFEECSPGKLRMMIADNGLGIGSEEQERVFHAFYTTKEGGTGLGLFSVKNIMDDLGGEIEVDSTEGEGSRFTIHIEDNGRVTTQIV